MPPLAHRTGGVVVAGPAGPMTEPAEVSESSSTSLRFQLGALSATAAAISAASEAGVLVVSVVLRHLGGDWGDIAAEAAAANDEALTAGGALRSAYRIGLDRVLVVTTDAERTTTLVTLQAAPQVTTD